MYVGWKMLVCLGIVCMGKVWLGKIWLGRLCLGKVWLGKILLGRLCLGKVYKPLQWNYSWTSGINWTPCFRHFFENLRNPFHFISLCPLLIIVPLPIVEALKILFVEIWKKLRNELKLPPKLKSMPNVQIGDFLRWNENWIEHRNYGWKKWHWGQKLATVLFKFFLIRAFQRCTA